MSRSSASSSPFVVSASTESRGATGSNGHTAAKPSQLGVAVIGCGYWGPNLLRNFHESRDTKLVGVADLNPDRLAWARGLYPHITATSSADELISDPRVDAVAIATPVNTHYELAMRAVRAGKHVLVEKPLCHRSDLARELIEEADKRKVTLMVDHTFIYTPAVRKIKQLIKDGDLGQIYYYDSARINLGLVQSDVNVLWDLAVHDLSIIQFLFNETPQAVSATGMRHISGRPETIAYLTLHYGSGLIAHCHVNWLSPVKVRRTLIGGTRKMVVYDDVEPSEKLRIYDTGVKVGPHGDAREGHPDYRLRIDYRKGDISIPHLEGKEALKLEVEHFVESIRSGKPPLSGGQEGLQLIRTLEAASQSLFLKGQPIPL
ncbi:MAG: Gfo/Idh/MocA family oxidoreductase [Opitutaceae bacterium]|nr:Gfo/Idh/MocA family oxidoreductase [Opitutaceae bacterium]